MAGLAQFEDARVGDQIVSGKAAEAAHLLLVRCGDAGQQRPCDGSPAGPDLAAALERPPWMTTQAADVTGDLLLPSAAACRRDAAFPRMRMRGAAAA